MRVDVRMRIEDRPACQSRRTVLAPRGQWSDHAAGGRHHGRLERGCCPCEPNRPDRSSAARQMARLAQRHRSCKRHERTGQPMNVLVTGGGTSAPIDDVRTHHQCVLRPIRRRDQRKLPGSRGLRLARARSLGAASPASPGPVRSRDATTLPANSIGCAAARGVEGGPRSAASRPPEIRNGRRLRPDVCTTFF